MPYFHSTIFDASTDLVFVLSVIVERSGKRVEKRNNNKYFQNIFQGKYGSEIYMSHVPEMSNSTRILSVSSFATDHKER
jgi:hypothetical protein